MKKAIMRIMKGETIVDEIVGGFLSADADKVVMQLAEGGEAHFPKDDDHWLEMTDEVFVMPKREVRKVEATEKVEKPKAERKPRESKGPSEKLLAAIEIVKANPTATRKEAIALIVEKTGMSEAGASTYHQNAKKWIEDNK